MTKIAVEDPKAIKKAISAVRSIREQARKGMSEKKREIHICRICLEENPPFVTPCSCKGTQAYVHRKCLNRWREQFSRNHRNYNICRECRQRFFASPIPIIIEPRILRTVPQDTSCCRTISDPFSLLIFISLLNAAGVVMIATGFDVKKSLHEIPAMSFITGCIGTNTLTGFILSCFTENVTFVCSLLGILNISGIILWWAMDLQLGLVITFGLSFLEIMILLFEVIGPRPRHLRRRYRRPPIEISQPESESTTELINL